MQRTVDHGGVGVYSESSHDGELWALLLLSEFVSFTSFGLGERCAPAACGRRGSETARGLLSSSGAGYRLGTSFLGNNDFFLLDLCLYEKILPPVTLTVHLH